MNKTTFKILSLALAMMLDTTAGSAATFDPEPYPANEVEMEQVQISVTNGSTIQVKNGEGEVLEVFSITGEKVYTQRIDSPSKSYELSNLPKGCYLVRVGKVTRKVYLK